jgi:hypothetical protein
LIYWAIVSAASFDCCCTSINFDCKPQFFQSKYWIKQETPSQHCDCLQLWQLNNIKLCYLWTPALCF